MINGFSINGFAINGLGIVPGAPQTTSVALQMTVARGPCRWDDTTLSATSWNEEATPATSWTETTSCE